MPVVVRYGSLSFVIRTKEAGHIGRPHCHVEAAGAECSVDLQSFAILGSRGFSERSLRVIAAKVFDHREELRAKWEELHGEG